MAADEQITTGCRTRVLGGLVLGLRAGLAVVLLASPVMAEGHAPADPGLPSLGFRGDKEGGYVFDTGILQGRLQPGSRTLGLTSVVHAPSGARLDGQYGILSYYRVFTAHKRYGEAAWDWPCDSKILPGGKLQVFWPAGEDHPFEITATYRWADPCTLDLETTVKAQEPLEDFEVFLASYFHEALNRPYVYARNHPQAGNEARFLLAERACGDWQLFPRDADVLAMVRDGRWSKQPHPVQWAIMPELAAPICLRRGVSEGPVVVLMAPSRDCFAVSTPYEGEGHYSLYLSLFGCDIPAGKVARARCRLVVRADVSEEAILESYRKYNRQMSSIDPVGD